MANILPLLILLSLTQLALAQNLVKNPSFELYKQCPKTLTQKKLKLKKQVKNVQGLPNYFNSCSNIFSGTKNPYGYQVPQDGDGFLGLILTSDYKNSGECRVREYVQLKLTEPLVAGYKYDFSMFVSLANNSGYATDQIGVVFTKEDQYKKGIKKYIGHPDINNPLNNFMNDTVNWNQISGMYGAKGGEEYILIGNFQKCNQSSRIAINPNDSSAKLDNLKRKYREELKKSFDHLDDGFGNLYTEKLAYYFLDNISVTAINSNDSISQLLPEIACTNSPIIPANAIELIEDGSFDLSKNRKNPYWERASKGTPDFEPGLTGIYLYSDVHANNREYIISKLKQQITPCGKYYFTMKIKRSKSHKYAVDKIGIALVDSFYFQDTRQVIDLKPVFETEKFKVIESTDQWIQICGEFTPNSCVNHIVIGNFSTDDETYIFPLSASTNESPFAHYLIDDVSLTKIYSTTPCLITCLPEIIEPEVEDSIPVLEEPFVSDTFQIEFETSSYANSPISEEQIRYLKEQLSKNPSLKIVVAGHTDSSGNEKSNNMLSKKRAQTVAQALIQSGISENRIAIKYFGSKKPLATNETISGRRKNRRVEIYLK